MVRFLGAMMVLGLMLGAGAPRDALADNILNDIAQAVSPIIPRGKGDQCVAPTDDMRRNHMDYIMHQRDETVVEGIRGKRYSLTECINCHAQVDAKGEAIRIDAPGQFCQSCHTFAAVKIDCFSCHRALPDAPTSTADLKNMPSSHHTMLLMANMMDDDDRNLSPSSLGALRYMPGVDEARP